MNWKNEFQPEHLGFRIAVSIVAVVVYVIALGLALSYREDNFQLALTFLALGVTALQAAISNLKITSAWKIGASFVLILLPAIIAILPLIL
ncbi:hypothetical protein [Enterobacter hormaechei]|uniref:hypothetical protein n=1 Tax=Enterobacter hormaechei TaxID=158836 RepID=UPI0007A74C6D|nr:hypothetical protein [Enterobacter hormaechei]ELC6555550.1 hypothetical protein [Enterobacter hormaechei]MBT2053136.1 hypothetical protein [Enterobacter hormaechei subsp. hoffmannii]MCU2452626.1 hypothetical protein [Enterobacter hormaechei subsp. hoffmannii]MCW4743734.1 hypothetical protein [Enterobacter hormaechei subsp. hoffmannii]